MTELFSPFLSDLEYLPLPYYTIPVVLVLDKQEYDRDTIYGMIMHVLYPRGDFGQLGPAQFLSSSSGRGNV